MSTRPRFALSTCKELMRLTEAVERASVRMQKAAGGDGFPAAQEAYAAAWEAYWEYIYGKRSSKP